MCVALAWAPLLPVATCTQWPCHFLQQFMTWKVPSRNLGMPLSQLLRDSQKTFQNDYLDDGRKEDNIDLVLSILGACHHVQQSDTPLSAG